jgi:hypothetical protein
MARKAKVQHNGSEIEVELEGWVPQEDIDTAYVAKAKVDQIVREEKAKAKRGALASALNDDDFKKQALQTWEIDLTKGTHGEKLSDQQLASAKADWEAKALKPLQAQIEALTAGQSKLQQKNLQKSILAAASAAKVKPELLNVLPGGTKPAIVSMLEGAFGMHDEDGEIYVKAKSGDGFELSSHADRTYATPEDYFAGIAGKKEFAHFFDRPQQSVGAGNARSAASNEPGVVANDPLSIGMNLEAIAKGTAVVAGTGA